MKAEERNETFWIIGVLSLGLIPLGMYDRDVGLVAARLPWMLGFVGLFIASLWMPPKLGFKLGVLSVFVALVVGAVWAFAFHEHTVLPSIGGLLLPMHAWIRELKQEATPPAEPTADAQPPT